MKTEQKTKTVLSLIVVVAILGYVFASFGNTDAVLWTFAILGIFLGLGIYSEVSIIEYFRRKKYKSISYADFLVWAGFIFGTVVILNSIIIIQTIREITPEWLINFLSINGAIFGALAGGLFLLLLWMPKPE